MEKRRKIFIYPVRMAVMDDEGIESLMNGLDGMKELRSLNIDFSE